MKKIKEYIKEEKVNLILSIVAIVLTFFVLNLLPYILNGVPLELKC